MKCKQAFLHGPFDLRIEEVELRELKDQEALVRVRACGICGSDVEILKENPRRAGMIFSRLCRDTNGRAISSRSARELRP